MNVWTNLGEPVFTSGIWNSENFTNTLTLDPTSTADLNWNTYNITTFDDSHSSILPSNVTVPYGAGQTFNFNVSHGYSFNVIVDGVSQGQVSNYTFSNVTEPHLISVVSSPLNYTISALTGLGSTITPGNVTLNYGANQKFNIAPNSGYVITDVYLDGVDQGNLTTYNFTNVHDNHTITVSSEMLAPTNIPTPTPSPTPNATPSSTPNQSNSPSSSSNPSYRLKHLNQRPPLHGKRQPRHFP